MKPHIHISNIREFFNINPYRSNMEILASNFRICLALGLMLAFTETSLSQWSHDPTVNNPVCTAANDQNEPQIVSDGSGGAIITWVSYHVGAAATDIYAQRMSASGIPLWTTDGVVICAGPTLQAAVPQIASDGAGGAIIIWEDFSIGKTYIQRINSNGIVQWTTNGIPISNSNGEQTEYQIISDGAGGAIITWADFRNGINHDIYAQRINANGQLQWTPAGVPICNMPGEQNVPQIEGDGAGGAIIVWEDGRSGNATDIYAQRINSNGIPQWTPNGVVVVAPAGLSTDSPAPQIVSDGLAGAIIEWQKGSLDVYAQRLNSGGVLQWGSNGVPVCLVPNSQVNPTIAADGSGGAIIAWVDVRNNGTAIYSQRLNANGIVQWIVDGIPVCTAPGCSSPEMTADDAGGAIITWYDIRSGNDLNIYAQRISVTGTTNWTTNGVAVSIAQGSQFTPIIARDLGGGAIISWTDPRSGTSTDIYAQRITNAGVLGSNPVFFVSPTSVSFGNVPASSSRRDSVFVTNPGGVALNISGVTSSSETFAIAPTSATIQPGATRTFIITFSPGSHGSYNDSIVFTHDAPGSPDTVTVSGTGVASEFFTATPPIDFGQVPVGGNKLDSVIVTNTGNLPLNISSVVSSDSSYRVSPQSGSIVPSGNKTFFVTFAPIVTGTISGQLTFTHNAPNGQDVFSMAGFGVTPGWSVDSTSISFGNVVVNSSRQDSVIVANIGDAPLHISGVISSNARFTPAPTSATILPGATRKFIITFSPDSQRVFNGNIIFTHDAPGSPDTVRVNGTGVSSFFSVTPANLNFGSVNVGSTRRDSVRVTNLGNPPITVNSVVSSNPQFSVPPSGGVINSGQSMWFYITFVPTAGAVANGSIIFTHNAAGSPTGVTVSGTGLAPGFSSTPSTLNFGNVLVGGNTLDSVIVTNTGNLQLNIASVVSSNPRFTVNPPSASIAPSGTRTFFVTLSPNAAGPLAGNLVFTHNTPNVRDTIRMTGNGVAPGWAIDRTSISFGNVAVSTTNTDSVIVTNSGTAPLVISGIVSSDTTFSVAPGSATIQSSLRARFSVSFRPPAVGPRSSNIVFFHNAAGSPDTVNASGSGAAAGFTVIPNVILFGNALVGTTKQDSFMVTNSGSAPLNIISVTSSSIVFTVSPNTATIPPGGTKGFDVVFSPNAVGTVNSDIVFSHNGPTVHDTTRVGGVGTAPALSLTPTVLRFPTVGLGSSRDTTVTITNSGTASLRIDSIRIRGTHASDFVVVGSSGPFPLLAPSGYIIVTLRFTPLDSTLRSGLLVVSSNASTSPDSLPIIGTGRSSRIQVTLTGAPSSGNTLPVLATPVGFAAASAKLFYRNAGKSVFDSLALTPNGPAFEGNFPFSVVNPRGIEYYIALFDINGQPVGTFPEITPIQTPSIVRVNVANLSSPQAFRRRVYKMISIPLELNDPSVAGALFDDYGQYDRSRWRLFRWENNTNVEYPALTTTFTPGTSFWLITQSGLPFDADNGRSVNSGVSVGFVLLPGMWTQIACPYAFPVRWDTSSGVRGPYYYDNGQYVPNVRTLTPWEGYFVRNDSAGPMLIFIPPVEASPSLPKGVVPTARSSDEYVVQFSAVSGELEDTYNYVGFLDNASVGEDRLDIPEPPLMGDFVALSIIDNGQRYIGDFKPKNDAGQQWQLEISSTVPNQVVSVSLSESGRLPEGFRVYVLDKDEFNSIPLSDHRFSVQLGSESSVRRLQVIVGTENYAREHAGGIPLVPVEYSLDQNYPNPFNPTTTIRYQLNKRSDVILEIFNILGQRIRTLVHSEQLTGSYSIVWDGLSDVGVPVASGMYIYRLNAGEFVSGRKLILLR